MRRSALFGGFAVCCLCVAFTALRAQDQPLTIVIPDVEGGGGTLIITPAGESLLIDAGWPGVERGVVQRIAKAARDHGCQQIDYFVCTHWHLDHYAGLPDLMDQIPIKNFYDRGPIPPEVASGKEADYVKRWNAAVGDRTTHLRPGDTIPLKQTGGIPLNVKCIATNMQIIAKDNTNAHLTCSMHEAQAEDTGENARSAVFILSYGDFQYFMGGDITWNIEHNLVCPDNAVEDVDMLQIDHHGLDVSSNPLLYHKLAPEVAVFVNGKKKGPGPKVVRTLRGLPSLAAVYQLHRNLQLSPQENAPEANIANAGESEFGQSITITIDKNIYKVKVGGAQGVTYPIQ